MKNDLNWQHLKYFLALASEGNLAAAADHIGSTQSTVFRQVRAFEQHIGAKLFESTPRGYTLTPAGEQLQNRTLGLEGRMDAISRAVFGLDDAVAGGVALTTTHTMAHYILPPILNRFASMYPGINLDLRVGPQFFNLSKREADIALRPSSQVPANLIGKKLGYMNFAVYAAQSYLADHPAEDFQKNYANHRFIGLSEGLSHLTSKVWFDTLLPPDANCTRVDHLIMAVRLCEQGLGIAVLPTWYEAHLPHLVRLHQPDQPMGSDLWLLTHKDTRDLARIKTTTQFLYESIATSMKGYI